MIKKTLNAKYKGRLPIGNLELECAVLEDGTRVLSSTSVFKAFGRPRKGMNQRLQIGEQIIPPFLAAKNLEAFITDELLLLCEPIKYKDGNRGRTGYPAGLIPMMCEVYLNARRADALIESQFKLANIAEVLLLAFARVGIDALIDEATGYQYDRKHNALRILLEKYISEGLRKWIKTFSDSFFSELDRIYGNATTTPRKRPQYYGHFINRYVYEPIENGYVKKRLNELNIDDDGTRKARFHQWLTDDGRDILLKQIGKVEGVMSVCSDINQFKRHVAKLKEISIAPYLFEEMNRITLDE